MQIADYNLKIKQIIMKAAGSEQAQKSHKIDQVKQGSFANQQTNSSSVSSRKIMTPSGDQDDKNRKNDPSSNLQEQHVSASSPAKSISKERAYDGQQTQHMGYDLLGVDGVEDLIEFGDKKDGENDDKHGTDGKKSRIAHKKLTKIYEEEENNQGNQLNENEAETANLNVGKDDADEEQFDPGSGLRVEDEDTSEDEHTNGQSAKNTEENGADEAVKDTMPDIKTALAAKLPMHLLRLDDLEEPLPLSATRHIDENERLRDKFKQFKQREEQRKKHAAEEYERKSHALAAAGHAAGAYQSDTEESGAGRRKSIAGGEDGVDKEDPFESKDLQEVCDGWDLFRRKRGNTMVRRYCTMLDADYMKHKITVCAYLNHIFDLYTSQRRPFMRTHAGQVERTRLVSAHHRHQLHYQQSQNGEPASAGLNKSYFNQGNYFNNLGAASRSVAPRINGMRSFKGGSGSSFAGVMNAGGQAYYEVKQFQQQIGSGQSPKTAADVGKDKDNEEDDANERRAALFQKQLEDFKSGKFGIMDPKLSNQVTSSLAYYRQQCPGIFYQNLKEEHAQATSSAFPDYQRSNEHFTVTTRPVKRVYLNFDKDLASRMFGYRVRFTNESMLYNDSKGMPDPYCSQTHKPCHFYAKDRVAPLIARYPRMQGFHSKQTIVRVLDSDNEEDAKEIEKNKKQIKLNKQAGNTSFMGGNPKIKKKQRTLPWHFDEDRPDSSMESPTKSGARRLRAGFGSNQKRLGHPHTVRCSKPKVDPQEVKSATMPAHQAVYPVVEAQPNGQNETTQETAPTTGTSTTASGRTAAPPAAIGSHLVSQQLANDQEVVAQVATQPPSAEQAIINLMKQSTAQSQQDLLALAQQPNPTPQSIAYLNQQIMLHYIAQQQQLQAVKNQLLGPNGNKRHLIVGSNQPTPSSNAMRTPQKQFGAKRPFAQSQSASKPTSQTLLSSQLLGQQSAAQAIASAAFSDQKREQVASLALAAEAAATNGGGIVHLERLTNHFLNWQMQQAENARSAQQSKMTTTQQLKQSSSKGLRPQSGLKPVRPAFELRQASVVNPISNAQMTQLVGGVEGQDAALANSLVSRQHHSLLNMATKMPQTVPNGQPAAQTGFVLTDQSHVTSFDRSNEQAQTQKRPSSKRRPNSKRKRSQQQVSQRGAAQHHYTELTSDVKRQDILNSYVPLVGNQQEMRQMTAATVNGNNGHNSAHGTHAPRLDSMSSLGASASSAHKIIQNPSQRGLASSGQRQSHKSIKVLKRGVINDRGPMSGNSGARESSSRLAADDDVNGPGEGSPYPMFGQTAAQGNGPYSASKAQGAAVPLGQLQTKGMPTTLTSGSFAMQNQYRPPFVQPFNGAQRRPMNSQHPLYQSTGSHPQGVSDYVPAMGVPLNSNDINSAGQSPQLKPEQVPRFLGSQLLAQSQQAVDLTEMMARNQLVGAQHATMDGGKRPGALLGLQHSKAQVQALEPTNSSVFDKLSPAQQMGNHTQPHRVLVGSKDTKRPGRLVNKAFEVQDGASRTTGLINVINGAPNMPSQFSSESKRQSMFTCYQPENVNDFRAVVGAKDQAGRHAHSVEKPKDLMISTHQSAGVGQRGSGKANVAPMNGSTTTTTTTSGVPLANSNESSHCYVARKPFDLSGQYTDPSLKCDKKMYSSYHNGPSNLFSDGMTKQRQSTDAQLLGTPLDSSC